MAWLAMLNRAYFKVPQCMRMSVRIATVVNSRDLNLGLAWSSVHGDLKRHGTHSSGERCEGSHQVNSYKMSRGSKPYKTFTLTHILVAHMLKIGVGGHCCRYG